MEHTTPQRPIVAKRVFKLVTGTDSLLDFFNKSLVHKTYVLSVLRSGEGEGRVTATASARVVLSPTRCQGG